MQQVRVVDPRGLTAAAARAFVAILAFLRSLACALRDGRGCARDIRKAGLAVAGWCEGDT